VPGAGNPQAYDRYAYVRNNPCGFVDPSGHYCETINRNNQEDCMAMLSAHNPQKFVAAMASLNYVTYSAWELPILTKFYGEGGNNARHGVNYIIQNKIHITVGKPIEVIPSFPGYPPTVKGDWQGLGDVAGWFDSDRNSIILNPQKGYKINTMPDTWGLGTIIHEAKHLEQGGPLTKYKELEAGQIGLEVVKNIGGYFGKPGQDPDPIINARDSQTLALNLSHDTKTINEYSDILRSNSPVYWFFYNFLPIDIQRPLP
jgi:hypothetical protein